MLAPSLEESTGGTSPLEEDTSWSPFSSFYLCSYKVLRSFPAIGSCTGKIECSTRVLDSVRATHTLGSQYH